MNRLSDAEEMFKKALDLRPGFGDALNALGVIETKRRNYQQALEYYREALSQRPNDAGIRMNVAITYYLLGRRAEAEEEYENAVELDENYEGMLDIFEE
jgi:tetratricopeptide (TPR) repeat protein